jgi:hypothetical protein
MGLGESPLASVCMTSLTSEGRAVVTMLEMLKAHVGSISGYGNNEGIAEQIDRIIAFVDAAGRRVMMNSDSAMKE